MTDADRQWRPSNGIMGEIWMEDWCGRCANDTFDEETGTGESCPILIILLCGDTDPAVTAEPGELYGTCSEFTPREGQ